MKTALNWRTFKRDAKNGLTTEATYHGKSVDEYLTRNKYPFFYFFSSVVSISNSFLIVENQMKQNMDSLLENHFTDLSNTIKAI